MSNYLIEVGAYVPGVGETILRYATAGVTTGPNDNPPNTYYHPRIKDPGGIDRGIEQNGATYSGGDLILSNADGKLDDFITYGWGRTITIRDVRDPAASLTNAPIVFRGTVEGVNSTDSWATVRMKLRDKLKDLDKPLLTETYAGTTITNGPTAEGDENLKGQIKPRAFGTVLNMAPVLVNPFDGIYQGSVGPVEQIIAYDGGIPMPYVGDFLTVAALQTATIVRGSYGTCLAQGLMRPGGAINILLTCDVIESSSRSAGSAAARILDLMNIPLADRVLDSFVGLNAGQIGLFVTGSDSAVSLIQQLLNTIGAALVPDEFGRFAVVVRTLPIGAPALRITMRNLTGRDNIEIANGDEGVPAWRVTVPYGRIWRTMAPSDLAGIVKENEPARADRLSKETLTAERKNEAVRTVHPAAREIEDEGLFVYAADAEARAAELLALESVHRMQIVAGIPEELSRDIAPGAVIEIDLPRFGLAGGKLFRVTSRRDDFLARQVFLTSWK